MTKYTKITPLGDRSENGAEGTFDSFFDSEKYETIYEAKKANDFVNVDFVRDEEGMIHFEFYHVADPENKKHYMLDVQHFPFGIDMLDDNAACEIAPTLFK